MDVRTALNVSPLPPEVISAVMETLELVRGQLDAETVHDIVEDALQRKIDERNARNSQQATNPVGIPGVQRGDLPRRESGIERTQREAQRRVC